MPNSDPTERVGWYKEIRAYLNAHNIPWTIWDYTGGFGVFEPNSNELFEYDLNVPLLEVLQFNVVPQKTFSMKPKTSGFIIYDDYVGEGIQTSSYGGSSLIDFYNSPNPYRGDHSIRWKDGAQYETIVFDFHPNANLSLMPDNGYALTFWIRCNSPQASFDIRFVDTKTGDSDRPWRMGATVDQTLAAWNGEWQQVLIPLAEMEEKGSWDDGWYEPEGKFQWSAIDRLEIVAEQSALVGMELFFDDIQLMGEEITIVLDVEGNAGTKSLNVYPNPLRSQTVIEFSTSVAESASICIYNQKGQLVRRLSQLQAMPGTNRVVWSGDDEFGERVSGGLYLVSVTSNGSFKSKRVVVLD